MRTPAFWYDTQTRAAYAKTAYLSALSALYVMGHMIHQKAIKPVKVDIPVICIGNLVAGGSGKTPTAMAIVALLKDSRRYRNPCFLSRGYGGTMTGPLLVDPSLYTARETGDEPLLLANVAPTIISADRVAGARFAREHGFDLVIMDDGLQNPSLHKDFCIVVIDGASGFGNEHLIPAGPLRTPIAFGLHQADCVLLIGEDARHTLRHVPESVTVLRAMIAPEKVSAPAAQYFGFSGIAQPDKFRKSLEQAGLKIMGFHAYPDHHAYTAADLDKLREDAEKQGCRLITTNKDAVRIPSAFRESVKLDTLGIALNWASDSDIRLKNMIERIHQ